MQVPSTSGFSIPGVLKVLMKAANEKAESRIMVGIHFRFACDAGQKMGDKVGEWTVKNHLEPLH